MSQKMESLPPFRVTVTAPFFHTGVDAFGHYWMKEEFGRREKKIWIILFTCMQTRAVHLELVTSMDAPAFFVALSAFIARRPLCRFLYSDNGTNFSAVDKVLKDNVRKWSEADPDHYAQLNLTWKFNPPHAPHRGGVWESMVKLVKTAMTCVLASNTLHFETLRTVLATAEAVVNRRPLTKLSDDPDDHLPLTPNHFLNPSPDQQSVLITDMPEPTVNLLKKEWSGVLALNEHFRKRFVREYLPLLHGRMKWRATKPSLKVGQLVLLVEETKRRGLWKIGVVDSLESNKNIVIGAHVRYLSDGMKKKCGQDLTTLPSPKLFYRDRESLVSLEGDLEL